MLLLAKPAQVVLRGFKIEPVDLPSEFVAGRPENVPQSGRVRRKQMHGGGGPLTQQMLKIVEHSLQVFCVGWSKVDLRGRCRPGLQGLGQRSVFAADRADCWSD